MLKTIHAAAKPVLLRMGYRWELWDQRSTRIGLWRKRWSSGDKCLVVLPGFGDSSLSWISSLSPIRQVIRRHYDEIVIADFAGFQGFLADNSAARMSDLIEGVHACLDALRPDCVLGHSLGGWLASHWSGAREKDAAKKLVLISPGGLVVREEELLAWKGLYDECREEGFDSYRKRIFQKEPFWFPLIAGGLSHFFKRPDILEFMSSIEREHFLDEHLKKIESEVWLIWGDRDQVCLPHWMQDWVAQINSGRPNRPAQAIVISGAGHVPHAEKPLATAKALSRALSKSL